MQIRGEPFARDSVHAALSIYPSQRLRAVPMSLSDEKKNSDGRARNCDGVAERPATINTTPAMDYSNRGLKI